MILGADPDAKPVVEKRPRRSHTSRLLNYFVAQSGGRTVSVQHRAALLSALKKLLVVYGPEDVQRYINYYFAHDSSKGNAFPLSFCSKALQEKLIDGIKVGTNDVDAWVAGSFVREEWMVLPWPAKYDQEIKVAVLRNPAARQEIIDDYL